MKSTFKKDNESKLLQSFKSMLWISLYQGMRNHYLVDVKGLNNNYIFDEVLIKFAKKNRQTVILNKTIDEVEYLKHRYQYDYLYTIETFNQGDEYRPRCCLVAVNVNLEDVRLTDEEYIIGGFTRSK